MDETPMSYVDLVSRQRQASVRKCADVTDHDAHVEAQDFGYYQDEPLPWGRSILIGFLIAAGLIAAYMVLNN